MLKKDTIRDVLSLALPSVGEMILYMMIGVFGTIIVGKYVGMEIFVVSGLLRAKERKFK